MKSQMRLLSLLGALGVAVVVLAEGGPGEKPSASSEVQELRAEVAELRARLQTLEDRMRKLESTVENPKPSVPTPLNIPREKSLLFKVPSESKPSPKIWGEREVNGWTFYVVPCGQQIR